MQRIFLKKQIRFCLRTFSHRHFGQPSYMWNTSRSDSSYLRDKTCGRFTIHSYCLASGVPCGCLLPLASRIRVDHALQISRSKSTVKNRHKFTKPYFLTYVLRPMKKRASRNVEASGQLSRSLIDRGEPSLGNHISLSLSLCRWKEKERTVPIVWN